MKNKVYWNAEAKGGQNIGYGSMKKAISTILVGGEKAQWHIDVDKKFNWFQKKMIKWCFGFEVKENK